MTSKKYVKSLEKDGKVVAKWGDDSKTESLLKICIEEIEAGNRPTTHFSKEGWKNITEKFQNKTGYAYDRTQLKNRWDTLKREFSSFVKLVDKQTGVGWDHEKKTIMADDDWWAEKSKEDPDILKWKHGGPKFVELLDKCFKGAIATGFALYKPYEDQLPCEGSESIFEDGRENNTITEDEGDADNFDVDNEVQPNPTPSSSKKRKVLGKGEKIGATEILQRSLDRILDGFGPSQQGLPEDNISYAKCLKMLDEIPSLVKGSHLHFKAVRILANKENMTTFSYFMNTSTADMALDWIDTCPEKKYLRDR
ncbi:L10-interacting MYB domain-containing protein [Lathyrus oleraceus]|uniref:Myb/SANT-like domain-containing protein n=1 Tax=Pisum sativum TaxID=3888 RepID=A0A9D5AAB2_PEA|nr:L10-interacting MYB domain-containing protein-like [Pisum sativum]KAI5398270.1 hypothetical protein KIW84_063891 [Pisum sativum]